LDKFVYGFSYSPALGVVEEFLVVDEILVKCHLEYIQALGSTHIIQILVFLNIDEQFFNGRHTNTSLHRDGRLCNQCLDDDAWFRQVNIVAHHTGGRLLEHITELFSEPSENSINGITVGLNINGMVYRDMMLERIENSAIIDTEVREGQFPFKGVIHFFDLGSWLVGERQQGIVRQGILTLSYTNQFVLLCENAQILSGCVMIHAIIISYL